MSYQRFIKGALMAYVFAGVFFALCLGGHIFISQYLKRTERVYKTLLKAKAHKAIIEKQMQRMSYEIASIKRTLNPKPPQISIYNEIERYEKLGFKVSPEGINRKGPVFYMPVRLRIQAKDLTEIRKRLIELMTERFPLLLVDSINISPNRQKTAIELTIRARTVAFHQGQHT